MFPRGRRNSHSENRTRHLHVELVERIHDRLDPYIVDFDEEILDRFFDGSGC